MEKSPHGISPKFHTPAEKKTDQVDLLSPFVSLFSFVDSATTQASGSIRLPALPIETSYKAGTLLTQSDVMTKPVPQQPEQQSIPQPKQEPTPQPEQQTLPQPEQQQPKPKPQSQHNPQSQATSPPPVKRRPTIHSLARQGDCAALETYFQSLPSLHHEVINATDEHGDSALHYACRKGYFDVVSLLLKRGASVDIKDQNGFTPLHVAASFGFQNIIELLVKQRAKVDEVDASGSCALHYACFYDHYAAAFYLVGVGASCTKRNVAGKSPLDLVKDWGTRESLAEAAGISEDIDDDDDDDDDNDDNEDNEETEKEDSRRGQGRDKGHVDDRKSSSANTKGSHHDVGPKVITTRTNKHSPHSQNNKDSSSNANKKDKVRYEYQSESKSILFILFEKLVESPGEFLLTLFFTLVAIYVVMPTK